MSFEYSILGKENLQVKKKNALVKKLNYTVGGVRCLQVSLPENSAFLNSGLPALRTCLFGAEVDKLGPAGQIWLQPLFVNKVSGAQSHAHSII